jgi:hypothetical protein
MSKNSAKSNYTQLMEWLTVRKQVTVKTETNQSSTRFSKADLYNGKSTNVYAKTIGRNA